MGFPFTCTFLISFLISSEQLLRAPDSVSLHPKELSGLCMRVPGLGAFKPSTLAGVTPRVKDT